MVTKTTNTLFKPKNVPFWYIEEVKKLSVYLHNKRSILKIEILTGSH